MNQSFLNHKSVRTIGRCLAVATLVTCGAHANAGTIDNIWNRVTSINNKASTIRSKVSILENRPDVRELASQVAPGAVLKVIEAARAGQDAIDILSAQREGFDDFKNGGGVDAMRDDLRFLFDDIGTLHMAALQLRCFQDPEVSLVAMELDHLRNAVEQIPALAMYGMLKALDKIAPEWRTVVSDINAMLPVEEVGAVCGAASAATAEFERLRCEVLRNINPTALSRAQRKAEVASRLFTIIKEFAPDEVAVSLSITVVGGGGAGTSIKLPLKGFFQTLITVLDRISGGASKVVSQRQVCLDNDEKIERDVLSCTALASYEGDIEVVRDLVLRRLMSLGANNQVWNEIDGAQSFGQICTSYRGFRIP